MISSVRDRQSTDVRQLQRQKPGTSSVLTLVSTARVTVAAAALHPPWKFRQSGGRRLKVNSILHKGWFMTGEHYCRRWFPQVFTIKKVSINMCPILNVYGVMGVFCHKRPHVNRALLVTLRNLEPAGTRTISVSYNSQLALFTSERRGDSRSVVAFSKTCFKAQVGVNWRKSH
jgi:hypothetical protein